MGNFFCWKLLSPASANLFLIWDCLFLFLTKTKKNKKTQVPKDSLLFIIPAFGGTVSWEGDGSPFGETDEGITHQVHAPFGPPAVSHSDKLASYLIIISLDLCFN